MHGYPNLCIGKYMHAYVWVRICGYPSMALHPRAHAPTDGPVSRPGRIHPPGYTRIAPLGAENRSQPREPTATPTDAVPYPAPVPVSVRIRPRLTAPPPAPVRLGIPARCCPSYSSQHFRR
ncbi:hypothetical protein Mbo2_105 [Rhodococcus phage Mbo2]|uniref:Uncharacterized protein n=1 Tax=Rhodococcus phage Mbo2 TaxID=2936911 RepID=A0A9E7IH02_9CAUD|nr:hypothetical protein Mbo2_105 [Rhodococcus phage Mbo2]